MRERMDTYLQNKIILYKLTFSMKHDIIQNFNIYNL